MFGKEMFAGLCEDWDTERNFNTFGQLPPSTYLLHTIGIYGDSSLPGTGPLTAFFRHVGGGLSFFLSLLNLYCQHLEIFCMPKRQSGCKFCSLDKYILNTVRREGQCSKEWEQDIQLTSTSGIKNSLKATDYETVPSRVSANLIGSTSLRTILPIQRRDKVDK